MEARAPLDGDRAPDAPLMDVVRANDAAAARFLLERGADVNWTAEEEGLPTPLFYAAYWGDLHMVQTLLRYPVDLTVKKYTGQTVIDVVRTAIGFAKVKKPKSVIRAKLPSAPPEAYSPFSIWSWLCSQPSSEPS